MKALHEDLQIKDFEMPDGVEKLEYCTATGQLATEGCTSRETGVYKSDFKPGLCETHGGTGTTTTTGTGAEESTTSSETLPHQRTTGSTTTTTVADLPPETGDTTDTPTEPTAEPVEP